jgi:hypothetical protein
LAALLILPGVFTFDAHVHVINRQFYHGGNIGDQLPDGQFDLPRARKGGVDALFFSLFVTEEYYPQHYETKRALRLVDLALRQLEQNRETIELARNGRDVQRIVASGKSPRYSTWRAAWIVMAIWLCYVSFMRWASVPINFLPTMPRTGMPIAAVHLPAGRV